MMAQHKSSMRRCQAAQSPLPHLDSKAAVPAQPRRRTAKVPTKVVSFIHCRAHSLQIICVQQPEAGIGVQELHK